MKRFLGPKNTLVVANGEKPRWEVFLRYRHKATNLIALDGAAQWLFDHNVKPDLVIGDMDSLSPAILANTAHISIFDQESNDLAKGLKYCEEKGLHEVTILGAFGLRLDHVLTNLFVVKNFARTMNINMVDTHQCAFMCPEKEEIIFEGLRGAYLSCFPLTEFAGPIRTSGVMYPLHNEVLSLTRRIGTLNLIIEDKATLTCLAGELLIMVPNHPLSSV